MKRYTKIIAFIFLILIPSQAQNNIFDGLFSNNTEPIIASARTDNGYCSQELALLDLRIHKAQSTLSQFTGNSLTLNQVPFIGLVNSGGGFRAAIAALGLWRGLEKIGLLDAVAYNATLSGSTWSAASWLAHGMSLDDLTAYLKIKMNNALNPENFDFDAIINRLEEKIKTGRHFSINDIYGALLADVFFKTENNSGQDQYLAQLNEHATNGTFPITLFTAAIGNTEPNYQWLEFSPFEIGSTFLSTWIPSSAIGKKFNNGETYDIKPEEYFGYLLGSFGSAYAVSIFDILTMVLEGLKKKHPYLVLPGELFSLLPFQNEFRTSPPKMNNFSYNLSLSPMAKYSTLTLVDAGIHINMPFIPLFRRGMNLYIVCDASGDSIFGKGQAIKKASDYAQAHNIPFPAINFETLSDHAVSIWYDENDPSIPVIIYVPNFQDFSTFKFDYSEQEFDKLMSGIEDAVTQNIDIFKNAINIALENIQKMRR